MFSLTDQNDLDTLADSFLSTFKNKLGTGEFVSLVKRTQCYACIRDGMEKIE